MKPLLKIIVLTALTAAWPVSALGDQTSDAVSRDRAVYDRLVRDISRSRSELSGAYVTAIAQARANDGEIPTALRAKILQLRERIDREGVRVTLVAVRHGWKVPDLFVPDFQHHKTNPTTSARRQLLPPDPVVSEALAQQARRLAAVVYLPTTPVTKASKRS